MTVTIPDGARKPADKIVKKTSARTEKARDDGLDRGIAFTENDGTRLTVTVGDVKGSQDAKLFAACGYDFVGLMEAMTERQGTDLLAGLVWFARLVNDRENVGTYESTLDEVTYEGWLAVSDPREPVEGAGVDLPKV